MAYQSVEPWDQTRKAQALLGVRVDGVWGPHTQAAFDVADQSIRSQIEAELERVSLSVYALQRVTTQIPEPGRSRSSASVEKSIEARKSAAPILLTGRRPNEGPTAARNTAPAPGTVVNRLTGWYTEEQLVPVLRAAVAGLQHVTEELMLEKLRIEAGQRKIAGTVYYNANSINGRYRGLFQMGTKAWSDIQSKLGRDYNSVFDPAVNARAAALYAENNVRVARSLGYKGPVTNPVLYAMHNQGATGFMLLTEGRGIQGVQSDAARTVIAQAISDARAKT